MSIDGVGGLRPLSVAVAEVRERGTPGYVEDWARRWRDARPQLKVKEPSVAVRSSIADAEALSRRVRLSDARLFDFGCGHGRSAIGLLLHGMGSYLGVDVRREAVAFARRLFAEHPNCRFEHLDAANGRYNKGGARNPSLPAPDRSCTVALAVSVFSHEPDDGVVAHYLGELWRVLTPDGVLASTWLTSPPAADDAHYAVRAREKILALLRWWVPLDCWGVGSISDHWWTLSRKADPAARELRG